MPSSDKRGHHGLPAGFVSQAQWRYFYGSKDPKLRALAEKEAHKAEAAGGGPKIAYNHLPPRKGVSPETILEVTGKADRQVKAAVDRAGKASEGPKPRAKPAAKRKR